MYCLPLGWLAATLRTATLKTAKKGKDLVWTPGQSTLGSARRDAPERRSGSPVIAGAKGLPGVRTAEGIQIDFCLSFLVCLNSVIAGGELGLFFWERELNCGISGRLCLPLPFPCLALSRSGCWRGAWGPEGLEKSRSRRCCLEG